MPNVRPLLLACMFLCAVFRVGGTHAQEVRVFLFDTLLAAPVQGGFLLLVDEAGAVVSRTLNDQDGLVGIPIPAPGRYHLKYERVGLTSSLSAMLELRENEALDYSMNVGLESIGLSRAGSGRVCGDPAGGNESVSRLWTEVSKALDAVVWSWGRDLFLHRTVAYRGQVFDTLQGVTEWSANRSGTYRPPLSFVSESDISSNGFAGFGDDGFYFYLPDPSVINSPFFLESHCFELRSDTAGELGLAFGPRERNSTVEVRGTLWVDSATSRLKSLQFSYIDFPAQWSIDTLTGYLTFHELESGAWIVDSWHVQLPEHDQTAVLEDTRAVYEGEDVLEIVDAEGRTVYEAAPAELVGVVYDSTSLNPLARATVLLEGTEFRTNTAADGAYQMRGPFAGNYGVTYFHTRLDSIGFRAPVTLVSLRPRMKRELNFFVPAADEVLESVCSDENAGQPFITGAVHDETGQPVPFAEIFVSSPSVPPSLAVFEEFDELQGVLTADNRGMYTICGAVPGSRISLRAAADDRRSNFVTLVFVQQGVMRAETFHEMNTPAWREDMTLLDPTHQTAVLEGVVTDTAGAPFRDARVRLIGTDLEATTDESGRFRFAGLPGGWTRLEARSVGYRSVERDVELRLDGTLTLRAPTLTLEPLPVQLADIVVEARAPGERRRALGDFEERRSSGQGTYLTRDEFMRMGSPVIPSDVLRTVRGLRVYKQGMTTVIETSRGATTFAGPCSPSIYLDNMYLGNTTSTEIDAVINLEHIEAVEVYTGSTVPFRFNRGCGAIVIWTR